MGEECRRVSSKRGYHGGMTSEGFDAITPRFLASFHPKRIAHHFADVLVIGSGLAGLRSALAVDPTLSTLVITKEEADQSNSHYAQGGIAAVWDPSDHFASHEQDTLTAGADLCDRPVVEEVVREAPHRIRELMEWGALFDSQDGAVTLGREGGHSFSRILHALGDATGQEVMRVVLARALSRENIRLREKTFTVDLLTWGGRCVGALTWSQRSGLEAIWAKETVLATGGCGQLYRETTNPPVATGDGLALAYRAGAELQDMEFMQFHPTVLYVAGSSRSLISEAVRGEGAYLLDRAGVRFMPQDDPRAELAPRDIVAQAIVRRMSLTNHPCVYLDQSHLDGDLVRRRFPHITRVCEKYGLDFARDPIPVRPGAHYMVGGVRTDIGGRTSLPGLWAAGEVAATGLHGANRLASNSLLEAIVFGARCGEGASSAALSRPEEYIARPLSHCRSRYGGEEIDLRDVRNALAALMFRDVGIQRTEQGLVAARENVEFWSQYVLGREFENPEGWELQNMLVIAGLMIRSALTRTESRGTHLRTDYPSADNQHWRGHLVFRLGQSQSHLEPCLL